MSNNPEKGSSSITWSRPKRETQVVLPGSVRPTGIPLFDVTGAGWGGVKDWSGRPPGGLAFGERFRSFDTVVTCSATCEQFRRSAVPHALIICAAFGDLCGTAPPKKFEKVRVNS